MTKRDREESLKDKTLLSNQEGASEVVPTKPTISKGEAEGLGAI